MKAAAAKKLGERIELALKVDPEAVRNVLSSIDETANIGMETSDSWNWIAGMLIIGEAINDAVSEEDE